MNISFPTYQKGQTERGILQFHSLSCDSTMKVQEGKPQSWSCLELFLHPAAQLNEVAARKMSCM